MPTVNCRVKVETPMTDYVVWVDATIVVQGPQKVGSIELEVGLDYILGWSFRGNTGQKYKITVVPPSGYTARFEGQHPIEGSIPVAHSTSGFTRRFYIKKVGTP